MKEVERTAATRVGCDPLESSMLRTLLYADLFKYPLKPAEITRRCDWPEANLDNVKNKLVGLENRGWIHAREEFYYLGEENGKVGRRKKGNALANQRMKTARKVSRFISKFPYVEAVMLSGSLSKDYMEEDSDIDFFIVTRPGRLWVARTLLVLFKKVFLLNSHKDFCVNYFVDTSHLEIEDKNLFTATEVVTLVPTCNYAIYEAFRKENTWADGQYPNYGLRTDAHCEPPARAWWGRFGEWILNGKFGEGVDNWCLKRTLKRWRTKFPDFSEEKFELALRSKKYVSKHHPSHFQDKVINKLRANTAAFESEHGVQL